MHKTSPLFTNITDLIDSRLTSKNKQLFLKDMFQLDKSIMTKDIYYRIHRKPFGDIKLRHLIFVCGVLDKYFYCTDPITPMDLKEGDPQDKMTMPIAA